MAYTKESIIKKVREENIDFIRLQFVDIFGQLKNVVITASQIEKAVGVGGLCAADGGQRGYCRTVAVSRSRRTV